MTSNSEGGAAVAPPSFDPAVEYCIVWEHQGARALVPAISEADLRTTLSRLRRRYPADRLVPFEVTVHRAARELPW